MREEPENSAVFARNYAFIEAARSPKAFAMTVSQWPQANLGEFGLEIGAHAETRFEDLSNSCSNRDHII